MMVPWSVLKLMWKDPRVELYFCGVSVSVEEPNSVGSMN